MFTRPHAQVVTSQTVKGSQAFPAITGSAIATGAIDAHIDIIVNGKTGTAMQAFKEQLSAVDIAAVVTYQRNALGNTVGDMVQPSAIQK